MRVTLKKGSVLSIPLLAGWSVSSGAPATASVKMTGVVATVTALTVGSATLSLMIASDLAVTLSLDVVA